MLLSISKEPWTPQSDHWDIIEISRTRKTGWSGLVLFYDRGRIISVSDGYVEVNLIDGTLVRNECC